MRPYNSSAENRPLDGRTVDGQEIMPPSDCVVECPPHEGVLEGVEWMDPSTIKFSQATISSVFGRRLSQAVKSDDTSSPHRPVGSYSEALKALPVLSVLKTLQQLKSGSLTVEQITPIRVCEHDGKLYTLDNRRLWVFREYGKRIPVLPVSMDDVSKEFHQKFNGESDGETVRFTDSSDKQADEGNESFLSLVLRWSVQDVMNERMYVNKVEPIPTTFASLSTYYNAFRWPLLEDTRGQVQQGLESVGVAPYMSLRSMDELKSYRTSKSSLRTLKLTTTKLGRKFVERNKQEAPWIPKSTDLVVLCTLVPEALEDLQRTGEHYTFAEIHSADREEDTPIECPLSFKVTAYAPTESPEYSAMLEERNWYAVFVGNLATGMRIWEALHPVLSLVKGRELVEETLYTSQACPTSESEHQVKGEVENDLESLVEKYCNFRGLNVSQTEAVRCTVMGLLNEDGFRVRLIQGPPGTGKTSTTTALVSIVSCLKDRILVCAPTNRAVSEVAGRFLQHLQKGLLNTSQFSDFTSSSIGIRFCRPLQMGDVVMIGNEDRVDTDGILGKIFMSHRRDRLLTALAPFSGWRPTAQLVVAFLRDAPNDFDLRVQLWKENQAEEPDRPAFLHFIRKQLNLIGKKMITNGHIMCNDLASRWLGPEERKIIDNSCVVLDRLLKSLANESLAEEDMIQCIAGAGACKCHTDEKICTSQKDFCSDKEKLIELMYSKPGYFVKGSYGAPASLGQIEKLCLKYACLVFSTTASAGRKSVMSSGPFQYAVIDEAAQLVEAETAIVTQLPGIKQALLVGDPQQLQALVISQIAKDCGYGRSLFERLQKLGHPSHILNVQYRMKPAISYFPNQRFYNGAVQDGPTVSSEGYKKPYQEIFGPYAFIDVSDGEEEKDENGKSWRNLVEAEVVLHLVTKIRAVAAERSQNLDLGVIAPYNGQVNILMKQLQLNTTEVTPPGASKKTVHVQIDVKTVDGFQGGEKDVILFSAVRANAGGHIGFADDARRLNVALTRGRYCIWIIGNASTLAHNEMWSALVEDAKRRRCFWDARDDPGLKKIIVRVKNKLDQIANLLEHDSILFNDTIWQVKFTKAFKETIIKVKSRHNRQRTLSTILDLANGKRPQYSTECTSATDAYKKLIHVQHTGGLILVWTIEMEKNPVKQYIKIWEIVDSSYIAGFVRRLEASFQTYTAPHIDRCLTVKFQTKKSKIVVPAVWKYDPSFKWHTSGMASKGAGGSLRENGHNQVEGGLESSPVEESMLLMKFYSLTSGIARQLLTAVDGSEIELLFEVNEEEATIIQYPLSTFILGRSGTGKTTVITTKLLRIEQQFRLASNALAGTSGGEASSLPSNVTSVTRGTDCLRQVVVTLSPKLCAAIKRHIARTSRTMHAENGALITNNYDKGEDVMLDEEEELKLNGAIPNTLVNISSDVFPLVITFRKFLAMIDGSVTCPFLVQGIRQQYNSLFDERGECEGSEGSSREAEQAVNESCSLREEDKAAAAAGGGSNSSDTDDEEGSESSLLDDDLAVEEEDMVAVFSSKKKTDDPGIVCEMMTEVTFEHFNSFYWPHFNKNLIEHFDSSVVFTEIISFIKGSLEALDTSDGKLNRQQYLSLAAKRSSNLDEKQRADIYSIFELYEKCKSVRREYDIGDYCMHLSGQMRLGNYMGLKFHYVYVDEVQDLTMAQISLFKHVCSNIEGYVFAGDTAQTIARGVSFRFEDIRHLFYKEFLQEGRHTALTYDVVEELEGIQEPCSSSKVSSNCGKKTSPKMPILHHLTQNFRTHVGIVKIANSIVQLLYHFFPNAIDKLDPETSLILGDTPIFLERGQSELLTSHFGKDGIAGGGGCDFGAEQVILVRDQKTKDSMIEKLGKGGLVMTVHECKGLEFQDVLLYNFFKDSLLESKWRVVYSYVAENFTSEDQNGSPLSYPQFNLQKHNLLMSELKQLYVVVTRARQRLWIYDECPAHHKPMLQFWKLSGLIEVKHLDSDLLKTIHTSSTPEEWRNRGKQLFSAHVYDMAQLSFERAEDLNLANWAKAARLQQDGEKLLESDTKAAAQLFRDAAELYLSLEKGEAAAKCYVKTGDNRRAGMIYRDSCGPSLLEEAGNRFVEAKCWSDAAEAYSRSFCFKQCLLACIRGKLFDQGVNFLANWAEQLNNRNSDCAGDGWKWARSLSTSSSSPIDGDEFEMFKTDYLKKCALYYHKQKNLELMMKFVQLFPSINARRVFLKRRDYFDQLITVEEGEGNFIKAAEMAENKGDWKHAARLLRQGGCHAQAMEKILEHARFEMLWSGEKHGWPFISTPESEDLLQSARDIVSACPHGIKSELKEELDLLEVRDHGLEHWKELKDSGNIRLRLIAGRQAIDEGLSQLGKLPASDKSCSALVPDILLIWDSWSMLLIALIQAINRAQRRRDTTEDEKLLECSNTYLGAVQHTQTHLFLVTDVSTSWLKNSQVTRLPNQGQRGQLASALMFTLAEKFWAIQLWHAGSGIIKMLEDILFTGSERTMQDVSLECFQPRGGQLCKLFAITDTLASILSQNAIQEECKDLRAKLRRYGLIIYEASFPYSYTKESAHNLLTFRQEVGTIYDIIATNFIHTAQLALDVEHDVIATAGRMQILLPLLSRQWIMKHVEDIEALIPQETCWLEIWHASQCIYGNILEDEGRSAQSNCGHWLDAIDGYCRPLRQVYNVWWECISPFMFVQILERGIVMDLACRTHLHSLFVPESLVVNHMTGHNNTDLYSYILNMSCTKHCLEYGTTALISRLILDMLNASNYTIESWFDRAKIDWRKFLPGLVFRLVISVLTICINSFDQQIWDSTIKRLRAVFRHGSPLLSDLHKRFMIELTQVLLAKKYPSNKELQIAFMKAMAAVKNPLIVLKQSNRKIPTWAHENKVRYMVINRKHDNRRVFGTSYSAKRLERPISGKTQNSDLKRLESERCMEDNALKTVGTLLRTGPAIDPDDFLDAQEQLPGDSEDTSQDAWIAGESSEDPGSPSIPSGHVSIGAGQTVPIYMKTRLLQHLEEARQQLKNELSACERYQRDAQMSFRKQTITSKGYLEVFLSKACPLKVLAGEWLQRLENSVQALKNDSNVAIEDIEDNDVLLDDIADSQDTLQKAAVILDPWNEEHTANDVNSLNEKLAQVEILLEKGKKQFLQPVNILETPSKDSKQNDMSSREMKASVNHVKGGRKPQKPRKKKRKGKK